MRPFTVKFLCRKSTLAYFSDLPVVKTCKQIAINADFKCLESCNFIVRSPWLVVYFKSKSSHNL